MTKHSREPWTYEKTEDTENGLDHLITGPVIPIAWAYKAEDARLIAAAPAMLEALRQVVIDFETIDSSCPEEPGIELARAAIALATGDTQ